MHYLCMHVHVSEIAPDPTRWFLTFQPATITYTAKKKYTEIVCDLTQRTEVFRKLSLGHLKLSQAVSFPLVSKG